MVVRRLTAHPRAGLLKRKSHSGSKSAVTSPRRRTSSGRRLSSPAKPVLAKRGHEPVRQYVVKVMKIAGTDPVRLAHLRHKNYYYAGVKDTHHHPLVTVVKTHITSNFKPGSIAKLALKRAYGKSALKSTHRSRYLERFTAVYDPLHHTVSGFTDFTLKDGNFAVRQLVHKTGVSPEQFQHMKWHRSHGQFYGQ